MRGDPHPEAETLKQFVLGRLDRAAMERVERHLRGCPRCASDAARVPDDRLVSLLRRGGVGAEPR